MSPYYEDALDDLANDRAYKRRMRMEARLDLAEGSDTLGDAIREDREQAQERIAGEILSELQQNVCSCPTCRPRSAHGMALAEVRERLFDNLVDDEAKMSRIIRNAAMCEDAKLENREAFLLAIAHEICVAFRKAVIDAAQNEEIFSV